MKTRGSQENKKEIVVEVLDEDADEFNRWVAEEKGKRRKIDDVRFEPFERNA